MGVITTIVFDIGGVFLHESAELLQNVWKNYPRVNVPAARQVVYSELWETYKRGGMTEPEYWQAVIRTLEIDPEPRWKELCDAMDVSVALDTELVSLVQRLKERYRIHALSNAGAELSRRLDHFQIDHLFEHVINSHVVKLAKPDDEIYTLTSSLANAKPEEILFVDDKPRNTVVAERLGFHNHVYTTSASFADYLVQSGLL